MQITLNQFEPRNQNENIFNENIQKISYIVPFITCKSTKCFFIQLITKTMIYTILNKIKFENLMH